MKNSRWMYGIVAMALIGISAGSGYWWTRHQSPNAPNTDNAHSAHNDSSMQASSTQQERTVLYWYDPMVPDQHFDKPGKSPFMDMQLVPKYRAAGDSGNSGIRIDPRLAQNLGMRVAAVERSSLDRTIDAVGTIAINPRHLAVVQARAEGFVQRVYARAVGDVVEQGAPLADLVVPAWFSAEQEFLTLQQSGDETLIAAASERLRNLGIPAERIHRLQTTHQTQNVVTITAPAAGLLQTVGVREGMTVNVGMTLAEINPLGTVWLEAAIPENVGNTVAVGDEIEARFTAASNDVVRSRVSAVLPQTNSASRTFTVRAEIPNPDLKRRPGQFAQVRIHRMSATPVLQIPAEAVIRSGDHNRVIAVDTQGYLHPVAVEIGIESNGKTEITRGLDEGQRVVISGQFLVDSEANLSGVLRQMEKIETGSMEMSQ